MLTGRSHLCGHRAILQESPTVFRDVDAGAVSQNPAEQVNVIGSTNSQAGGESHHCLRSKCGCVYDDQHHWYSLATLNYDGARHGLDLRNSYFIAADWLDIRNGENGLWAQMASNIVVSHSVFMGHQNAGIWLVDNNKGTMNVGSSVLWSNRYGIYVQQGYATVSNSILAAVRPDSFGFYRRTDTGQVGIQSDYNSLYSTERAGGVGGLQSGSENSARTTAYFSVSTCPLLLGKISTRWLTIRIWRTRPRRFPFKERRRKICPRHGQLGVRWSVFASD